MVEPVTTIAAVAEALGVAVEALRSFARRGSCRRLLRLVRTDINRGAELSPERRAEAASVISNLHVDPQSVGALYRYLENGEDDALVELTERLAELLDSQGDAVVIVDAVKTRAPDVLNTEKLISFEARVTREEVGRAAREQGETLTDLSANVETLLARQGGRTEVLLLDWASERQRRDLAELSDSHPDLVSRLNAVMEELSEDERPDKAEELLRQPPPWLEEGPPLLTGVVIRIAEKGGKWRTASDAWEDIADRRRGLGEKEKEHDALMNAAVSAEMVNDLQRNSELLELVRSERPNHPRLILEEVGQIEDAQERLRRLENVEAENDDERALLSCHRALAHLIGGELAEAQGGDQRSGGSRR